MKHRPRGRVIIINNEVFSYMATRDGTEKDKMVLKSLFLQLGFTCVVHDNLTKQVLVLKNFISIKHNMELVQTMWWISFKYACLYIIMNWSLLTRIDVPWNPEFSKNTFSHTKKHTNTKEQFPPSKSCSKSVSRIYGMCVQDVFLTGCSYIF